MKMARVYANEGYRSEKMPLNRALYYKKLLERLGNYNVEVVPL